MNYVRQKMNKENALLILKWRYEPPYDTYDFDEGDEAMRELLEEEFYSVHTEGHLIGFYCVGKSSQVPAKASNQIYSDQRYADLGLGMRPDLTGKGQGREFVEFTMQCINEDYPDKKLRLTVLSFNQRAIKTYESLGFKYKSAFLTDDLKREFTIMTPE